MDTIKELYNSAMEDSRFVYYEENLTLFNYNDSLFYDDGKVKKNLGKIGDMSIDDALEVSVEAPFGNLDTMTTEINKSVRDARELLLKHVKFGETEDTAQSLDIDSSILQSFTKCPVRVEPYKMTIYGVGQFFKPHTDSSEDASLLGSIVLSLNSNYKGGDLVVRHRGQKHAFYLQARDTVFFYGDCEHEITPVTEGTRMCLIFKVFADETATHVARESTVRDNVNKIVDLIGENGVRNPTMFELNHAYANWPKLSQLKGGDRRIVDALVDIPGVEVTLLKVLKDIKSENDDAEPPVVELKVSGTRALDGTVLEVRKKYLSPEDDIVGIYVTEDEEEEEEEDDEDDEFKSVKALCNVSRWKQDSNYWKESGPWVGNYALYTTERYTKFFISVRKTDNSNAQKVVAPQKKRTTAPKQAQPKRQRKVK